MVPLRQLRRSTPRRNICFAEGAKILLEQLADMAVPMKDIAG
jgi:hypothetical protein